MDCHIMMVQIIIRVCIKVQGDFNKMVKLKNYVSDLWKITTPICGRAHNVHVKMELVADTRATFCYECPECRKNNTVNSIPMNEFEKMINALSKKIYEEEAVNGAYVDLTNYGWTKNGIRFDILKYEKNSIDVKINNRIQGRRTGINP